MRLNEVYNHLFTHFTYFTFILLSFEGRHKKQGQGPKQGWNGGGSKSVFTDLGLGPKQIYCQHSQK